MKLAVRLRFLAIVVALIACAQSPQAQPRSALSHELAELWQEPDRSSRARSVLRARAAPHSRRPRPTARSNSSPSRRRAPIPVTTCKDASGRVWSVKLGIEAQPEVTASRILWAMGFHQPPQYFVHQFTLKRRRRRRQEQRALPHRSRSVGSRSATGRGTRTPFMNTRAVPRPDRRAADPEQLGPEDDEQPALSGEGRRQPSRSGCSWCATSARRSATRSRFPLFKMLGTRGQPGHQERRRRTSSSRDSSRKSTATR